MTFCYFNLNSILWTRTYSEIATYSCFYEFEAGELQNPESRWKKCRMFTKCYAAS